MLTGLPAGLDATRPQRRWTRACLVRRSRSIRRSSRSALACGRLLRSCSAWTWWRRQAGPRAADRSGWGARATRGHGALGRWRGARGCAPRRSRAASRRAMLRSSRWVVRCEVPALLLAAPLQADDLPVRAAHGALCAELSRADGGHAGRAFRCHSRRDDAVHGEEQQERQQGDQRSRGRRRGDVLGRGSEHATDARDGRCVPAPPGRRTPVGPSMCRDERRHEAGGRRCSIGT